MRNNGRRTYAMLVFIVFYAFIGMFILAAIDTNRVGRLLLALGYGLTGVVVFLLLYFWKVNVRMGEQLENAVKEKKTLRLRNMDCSRWAEGTDTIIWEFDLKGRYTYMSPNVQEILGYRVDEIVGKRHVWDLHPDKEASEVRKVVSKTLETEELVTGFENPMVSKDGDVVWMMSTGFPLYDEHGNLLGYQGWDTNISDRKVVEDELMESEKKFRSLFENMEEALVINELIYDENGEAVNYRIVDANDSYEEQTGLKVEDVRGKPVDEVFNTDEPPYMDIHKEVAQSGGAQAFTRYFAPLKKYFRISVFSPKKGQTASIFIDLSKERKFEETIDFLSYRDKLTKLHNRRYYEENIPFITQKAQMPLSVLLSDLNALKIANDAFGHQVGDQVIETAANLLEKHAPKHSTLCRIGGDEFIMLMPNTPREDAKQVMKAIKAESKQIHVDKVEVSISLGLATMQTDNEDFSALYKLAEAKMYRYKLDEGPKVRERLLALIEKTLFERYRGEQDHSDNVRRYAQRLAETVGCSEHELKKVDLAARYHDIGKIALDENILNKEGALSEYEWIDVKRHSEIAYRILSGIPRLAEVSEYILSHHENYDGTGYPKREKGKDIPKISRILRICDAYDAMTSFRFYRDTLDQEAAIEELKRCKGKDFDPELVDHFVEQVLTE